MGFNSKDYLLGQIDKQHIRTKKSRYKLDLDHEEYHLSDELRREILSSDIQTLQNLVREGRTTYAEIAMCFWNETIRQKRYNAVISLNETIVQEAEELVFDEEHDLLYGMPVLVKDNISVKGMPVTAGAAVLRDYIAEEDAELIQLLKEKGALILGKTNLTEWANFMSTDSSNGYSAVGGQTMHPLGQFDVGGSSAGSAAAAALSLSPVTVGSETAGSIIYPASQNGVVGLKPTLGLVSQDGIIPISKTHDTAGPIAKTVKDTYLLFKGMASAVSEEAEWSEAGFKGVKTGILENESIKSLYREEDEEIIEDVRQKLKEAGAIPSEYSLDEKALEVDYVPVLKYEFNTGIKSFFNQSRTHPLTLETIRAFNEEEGEDQTAPFNQELLIQSAGVEETAEDITQIITSNQTVTRQALEKAFDSVDVLLTLSNYATAVYSASGYPAVTVPGYVRATGEPIGITLIGQDGEDVRLMELAYALEQIIQ